MNRRNRKKRFTGQSQRVILRKRAETAVFWKRRSLKNTMNREELDRYLRKITPREKEIFHLLVQNYSTRDIAKKLNISEKTVRNHISNSMQKLGVKGRAQAVVELLKIGELTI